MNTESLSKKEKGNAVSRIVSGSVFSCTFCGYESKANHPIDKGYYEPSEPIKNFWTKKHRIYVCTNCIIKHNPHRCTEHPTESILYIGKLTKGDKANMARSLHLPLTVTYMTRLGFEILTYQNNRTMKKEKKQQNSTDTQMGYDTVLAPVDDVNSECYGCEAGMCHDCSLKDNWDAWQSDNYEPMSEQKEVKEPEMVNKEILVCDLKCGWQHDNPSEWHHYERATNGNLCKTCGRCSAFAHTETVRVPFNGC